MKIEKIHIEAYKIFKHFDIDFSGQNLIVLAGINGSGKTTLLEFIYNTLSKSTISRKSNLLLLIGEDLEKNFYADPLLTVMLHAKRGTHENKITFDKKFIEGLTKKIKSTFCKRIIYYKANNSETKSAKQIIRDYINDLIFEKNMLPEKAYKKLRDDLKSVLQEFDIKVEFDRMDKKKELYFKNETSDNIKIDELSGGEKELITKIFPLVISNIHDSVILIDEPESSLHPNWQNSIVKVYERIAKEQNNQVILATHSPHIVSSVKKEQVKVLYNENGNIRIIDDFSGSYGWKVDKVLLEIFKVNGLRTPAIENKMSELRELVHSDQYDSQKYKNLMQELENILGYSDSDLSLTRLEIARRRKEDEKNK